MSKNTFLDTGERLHAAGLKSTRPRRAVLEVLDQNHHLEASAVYEKVQKELPATSLQAVYGVLTALTDVGLARKIEPQGQAALFESRVGDNHHHLVCSQCGRIEDVSCVIGAAPCLTPSDNHGFTVNLAEVTFVGLCPACKTQQD